MEAIPIIYSAFMWLYLSQLWKDNILNRISEYTFIGIGMGLAGVSAYWNIVQLGIQKATIQTDLIIALILGVLIFFKFVRGYEWMSRWTIGMLMGLNVGVTTRGRIPVSFIRPLMDMMKKATVIWNPLENPWATFTNLFVILTFITTVTIFTYTREHTGWYGILTKIGRWMILGYVGAIMPIFIQTRLSVFYSIMKYLIGDLLHLI